MTRDPHPAPAREDFPASTRLRLRALREDVPPRRDLWPGIAAGIEARAPAPHAAQRDAPARGGVRTFAWLATAASVVVALAIDWRLQPPAATAPVAQSTGDASLLVRQADAMDREYRAALREVEASRPIADRGGALDVIDRAIVETRAALMRDPSALFLFEQLQRIQAQRLALARSLPASI